MWSKVLVVDRFPQGADVIVTTENCNAYKGLLLSVDEDCVTIIQNTTSGALVMYTDIQLEDIEAISLCESVTTINALKEIANEPTDGEIDKESEEDGETEQCK